MHTPDALEARPPAAAMVVDDDPGINRLLQVRLRNLGYTVTSATNGEEALAALERSTPDLMLLDVSMPGVGGLEVLDEVRARRLDVAVVMTTAFGSERVAIEALRRGADDYLRKPFEPDEFRAVIERTAGQLYLRRQNRALRARLEAELRQAGDIQANLLPDAPPTVPGYQIVGWCQPARAVGGDFYDWLPQPDGRLSLTLGDVMGKGMPAALLMTTARAALRAVAVDRPPAASIRAVAQALATDLERARSFITLFHAQLTPETGEVVYVDAGHGLACVRRRDRTIEMLDSHCLPLGVAEDSDGVTEGRVTLLPGDTLLVYSDGVLDAHRDHAPSPAEAIRTLVSTTTAGEIAARLAGRARSAAPLEDDLTFVLVQREEPAAP